MNLRTCVIFGGTGCIGTHIAKHLLEHTDVERIYLADIRPPRQENYVKPLLRWMESTDGTLPRVVYVPCDVRLPLDAVPLPQQADLIINLAAVHREPGHEPNEYYETNLPGAEHICAYATHAGCFRIVFTSSISPYGSSDAARNEDSLPIPETAYGGSKLVAEKIHMAWQHANPNRRLIVLRPGVVFGPGEHANVARLVRSLGRGYFLYMGNRATRKAGVYVKELCRRGAVCAGAPGKNRRAGIAVECVDGSAADAGGFCECDLRGDKLSASTAVGAAKFAGGRVLSRSRHRAIVWNSHVGESSADEEAFAVDLY